MPATALPATALPATALPAIVCAIAMLGLIACQSTTPGTVPAAEARLAQLGMAATFVPPQRTVADIDALIAAHRPDPLEIARYRTAAAAPVAPGDWRGLFRRSFVAYRAGRTTQQLEDLRAAVEASKGVGQRQGRRDVMRAAAHAELEAGNFERAIALMDEAVAAMSGSVGNMETLVQILAEVGDIERMRRLIPRTLSLAASPSTTDPPSLYRDPTLRYLERQAEGRWAEAERYIRRSIEAFERDRRAEVSHWKERRQLVLAGTLQRQGRLVEAEAVAREALASFLRSLGSDHPDSLRSLLALARNLYLQERWDEALRIAGAVEATLDAMAVPAVSDERARAAHLQARIRAARGAWAEAAAALDAGSRAAAGNAFLQNRLFAQDAATAVILALAGRLPEAARAADAVHAHATATLGPKHARTAEARAAQALVAIESGDVARALAHYRESIDGLLAEGWARDADALAAEVWRRRVLLEGYLAALARADAVPGLDRAAEALRVAEAARASTVSESLVASAERLALRDPAQQVAARRGQDLTQQIQALEGHLANLLAAGGDAIKPVIAQVQANLAQLRAEHDRAANRRREGAARPPADGAAAVLAALQPDEALIAYYVAPRETYAIGMRTGRPAVLARIPAGADALAAAVGRVRATLQVRGTTVGDVPDFDIAGAHGLYRLLLLPLAETWRDARSIAVVPHGPVGHLPLALLPTTPAGPPAGEALAFAGYRAVPWLARSHAVANVPSVGALLAQRAADSGTRAERPFLGFGDPVFDRAPGPQAALPPVQQAALPPAPTLVLRRAPQTRLVDSADLKALPPLPETGEEVREVARALKADLRSDVLLGADASEARVRQMSESGALKRYRVLSFATHGLVPGDLDGLAQPALALSAPDRAEDDGLLTMEEIMGLSLNADWVVLSGCNTAAADGLGSEAVSGLGRAFFHAGTRAVLASNWPVHSEATAALMVRLFDRQAREPGISRAKALQAAMLEIIDHGTQRRGSETVFSYAHPLFWAPFALIGDGR